MDHTLKPTPPPNIALAEPGGSMMPPSVRHLVHAEYEEMPGLSLTPRQAAKLWGLSQFESEQLLTGLVDEGFLMRDRRGAYRRGGCPRCS